VRGLLQAHSLWSSVIECNSVIECIQNTPFSFRKLKNFVDRGHRPLPRPHPQWEGVSPSPVPSPLSAPAAPRPSRRSSRLRCSTLGLISKILNTPLHVTFHTHFAWFSVNRHCFAPTEKRCVDRSCLKHANISLSWHEVWKQ